MAYPTPHMGITLMMSVDTCWRPGGAGSALCDGLRMAPLTGPVDGGSVVAAVADAAMAGPLLALDDRAPATSLPRCFCELLLRAGRSVLSRTVL